MIKNVIKFCKTLEKKYDKKLIRKLKDMKNSFYDKEAVKKILKRKNPIIYVVFRKKIENLYFGLTIVNPGVIGEKFKEFYMTKGHKHKKPSPEFYILLEGKGKVLIQNKISKFLNLKKNKTIKVPKKYAHRLINIGNKKLKVLTIYEANIGHDYRIRFKKRLFNKKI